MPEVDTMHPDALPLTVESLAAGFAACGLAAGQTVLVHSSLSRFGWIVGGAEAVILALLRVLGHMGTLMMPAHTNGNTDPANWQEPPVPSEWWPIIRAHMPAYDPARSPTREMGRIAELFRTWPGVLRSEHPTGSFAALGPQAAYLTAGHTNLSQPFGDTSPVGKLYALDGWVLLLGVGHGNNTSLHLAEARATYPGKRMLRDGAAMTVNGVRQWVAFDFWDLVPDDFPEIGDSYEAATGMPRHHVGRAEVRFLKQRPLVDYAVQWMETYRNFER